MSESVRESITRGMDELRSRDSGGAGGGAPERTHHPAYMADVQERTRRREDVDNAAREVSGGATVKDDYDQKRRNIGEARGFERMRQFMNGDPKSTRMPTVRPDGRNPTVRESFYAAMEELRLPNREVTESDPLTGKTTLDLVKGVDYVDMPPDHWQGVHPQEFHGLLTPEAKKVVKEAAAKRQEFEGWNRRLGGDPKTKNAALFELAQRFPNTDPAQVAFFQNHIRNPSAKMVRPAIPWLVPPGFTIQNWAMIPSTSKIRGEAKTDAEKAFYYTELMKLLENPATRGHAWAHIFDNYSFPETREQFARGQMVPGSAMSATVTHDQAVRFMGQWAKDKPHYHRDVPIAGGGTAKVRHLMGQTIQANPQIAAAYNGDIARMLSDVYQEVVRHYGLHLVPDRKVPKPEPSQRKKSSSMRSSSPDPTPAPAAPKQPVNKVESPRESIVRALAELRS